MHPEMSLILLTVLAGTGQGIFISVVMLDLFLHGTGVLSDRIILLAGGASIGLQLMGMLASVFHLGNPQRGWKAILMWRNSWLSREVISLSLSFGMVMAYTILFVTGADYTLRIIAGLVGVAACLTFFISSSMVYTSIRFIREWASVFTPLGFILFGITSGVAIINVILPLAGVTTVITWKVSILLVILATISLFLKIGAYRSYARMFEPLSLRNAIGSNASDIRLMDVGTSYRHYNTREYFFPLSTSKEASMQKAVIITAFAFPLMIWIHTSVMPDMYLNTFLSSIAALSMMAGLILERRLFFIQGNHLQNLYYGNFRKRYVRNPLLKSSERDITSS